MAAARRIVLAAATAILASLWSADALAQFCTSGVQCPTTPLGGGRTCIRQTIFGVAMFWGNCTAADACNTGLDCIPQAVCDLGKCRRPRGTCLLEGDCADDERCAGRRCESTRPSGSGSGVTGEGRRCMPANGSKPADWAKDKSGKPLGACAAGTSCSPFGYCVRLAT